MNANADANVDADAEMLMPSFPNGRFSLLIMLCKQMSNIVVMKILIAIMQDISIHKKL